MANPERPTSWPGKFAVAISGLAWAVRTQSSFWIHLPIAAAVIIVGALLQVELWRWAALVLAIALVMTAELLNSAIEQLVTVLHPDQDQRIGQALDAAAAGVLIAAICSVAIGLITLGPPLWQFAASTF
ncbi:MAG: diacylglycerol kinase family protein [Pirellulaceae bacterium]|nr:diacylglycerol kinase family protein [Pirellulaceae bacterium]